MVEQEDVLVSYDTSLFIPTDDVIISQFRKSYPHRSHEAVVYLRFLMLICMALSKKTDPNYTCEVKELWEKRLRLYTADMISMGYKSEKLMQVCSWVCEHLPNEEKVLRL